jgi:ribosome maturation factor RimP
LASHPSGLAPLFFLEERRLAQSEVARVVQDVALRVTADRGFELVDVEIKKQKDGPVVRLFVDKEGGIGLEELESVSHEVSAILDAEDPIKGGYTLEVSSPGLDRPLKDEKDFRRFVGRLARISSYEPIEGRRHWTGRLLSVEEGAVTVELPAEKGVVCRIPLGKVAAARLEAEFPR